ncbi:MAG TPA: site-2 protease family protein [Candidatus Acidoferrales bacterium]|nr:site-2 protease family protein [Candidatus Acidoferrales bacterium]
MSQGSGLKIGKVFGIPIYLHPTWFIIFLLITYLLIDQFTGLPDHPASALEWGVAIVASLLFFASVILHELGHSVVALRYKIPVVSITLYAFGGLARIAKEPEKPLQEFNIAIAGPIVSFVLAGVFFGLSVLLGPYQMIAKAAAWLAGINGLLGLFNLAPGFPLDGGRILRAAVWAITGSYSRATRIASQGGKIIAYAMIFWGAYNALYLKNYTGGIWIAFIGWFLLTAAQESYAQLAVREALAGLRAADIMSLDLPTVPRDISLEEYGHLVLRTGRRCHLVASDGKLSGLMTTHALNHIPREEWHITSIQAAMLPLDKVRWAAPEEPVLAVLDRMQSEDINQMPVLQQEPDPHVVGIVSRDSILRVIQTRTEIGKMPAQ